MSQGVSSWPTGQLTPVPDEPVLAFWPALLRGLLTAAFGVVLLVWPHVSVHPLGVFAGLWLLFVGVAHIVGAFVRWRGLGWQVLSGAVGILFVVGGVACLRDVTKGVLILAFLIALAWIFIGLAELATAALASGRARTWLILLGIVAIVIGFAFMLWPAPSLTVVVVLAGISSLVVGIADIVVALRLRKLTSDPAQQKAIKAALRRRLCIITGGPGTGKTRTATIAMSVIAESA